MRLSGQDIGKEKQTYTDALLENVLTMRWRRILKLGWVKIKGKESVQTLAECVVESREDKETMFRLGAQVRDRTTHYLGRPEEEKSKGR